jgi:hypothetical protein
MVQTAGIYSAATLLVFVSSLSWFKSYEGWKKTQIAEVHQTGADVVSTITSHRNKINFN